jgi:hypothetical protein
VDGQQFLLNWGPHIVQLLRTAGEQAPDSFTKTPGTTLARVSVDAEV